MVQLFTPPNTNPPAGSLSATVGDQKKARSWLEQVHPEYAREAARWAYTMDAYTGEVVDPAKVSTYLVRKASGENADAYKERCALADYTTHFATVVDSLVGMLFGAEQNANRVWNDEAGKGLGDPEDQATPIGRLWRRADLDGNGYLTVFKQMAVDLVLVRKAWMLVDSVGSRTVLRILPASAVKDWRYGEGGVLVEALVEEVVDARERLQDEAREEKRFVHFTTAGWQRYRLSEGGLPVTMAGPGEAGTYSYQDANGTPSLPLFRVTLPMRRDVGYLLARKAVAIFNKESERDHLLRTANFTKLVLAASNTLFTQLTDDLKQGANVLQEDPEHAGGHRYIAPDTGPATVATEVLKRKVEEYFISGFREYGDAARERTATEVRQDVASGVGAFLQMLKAALDDAENAALWRMEQVEYPNDRRRWFTARVERSDDFLPADPEAVLMRQVALVYGKDQAVPLGKAGMLAVARQVAAYQGIEVDDAELEAAVEVRAVLDVLQRTMDLELPALARAELTMRMLAASGLVSAEEVVQTEAGERKLLEVLRTQVAALAQAKDDSKLREAELLADAQAGNPGKGNDWATGEEEASQ